MINNLSFSRLGSYGRLGNQLFQIAGTLGIAQLYQAQASFPEWAYEKYFIQPLPNGAMQTKQVKEQHFHYHDWQLSGDSDIFGYLQSEKYFPKQNPFVFKPAFLHSLKDKIPLGLFDKQTVMIHIRRGDFVSNTHYYQVPINYYIDALLTHFPNWQDYNIVFFSDDLAYCRVHFECLPNAFFIDGLTDIEAMALATMMDHFIIGNSSYGWWCAWLGEKPLTKIIHCGHLHAGKLLEQHEPKDYYPDRWTRHQKHSYTIPLRDITFTIPVFCDHKDRKQNLDLSVCMLQHSFDTNIIVGEQGGARFAYFEQWCTYIRFTERFFHRTKMLNAMAMQAVTPFVANWDCDVIIPPMQIYLTVCRLKEGADMAFPYDGRFARLPRALWFAAIQKVLDIGAIGNLEPKGKRGRPVPESSVGGAVFFNKVSFVAGGMENEYMISFGPEDCERNDRFTALGYRIERTHGCLYHIDHYCGADSSIKNPFFKANHAELNKIRLMGKTSLLAYINSWPWRRKYYDETVRNYQAQLENKPVNENK